MKKRKIEKHSEKFDDCYYNHPRTIMYLGCGDCKHLDNCEDEILLPPEEMVVYGIDYGIGTSTNKKHS